MQVFCIVFDDSWFQVSLAFYPICWLSGKILRITFDYNFMFLKPLLNYIVIEQLWYFESTFLITLTEWFESLDIRLFVIYGLGPCLSIPCICIREVWHRENLACSKEFDRVRLYLCKYPRSQNSTKIYMVLILRVPNSHGQKDRVKWNVHLENRQILENQKLESVKRKQLSSSKNSWQKTCLAWSVY